MYHKVARRPSGALVPHHYVSPARFANQMRALVRFGFKASRLSDLSDWPDPSEKSIGITFDDGYENFAPNALPALEEHGLTGTVFVVAGLMGKTNEWDTKNGDVPEPLLNEAKIKELDVKGIEIGSHSLTHARLTEVSAEEALNEIVESQRILSGLLAKPIDQFCYPYGAHNEGVRELVRSAGYQAACSVEKGWNDATTDPYRLRRTNVRSDTSTPVLFWKLWRQSRLDTTDR